MATETQVKLFQALSSHTLQLQRTRSFTSGRDLEVLDRRIEAAHGLLEWIERGLELGPPPPALSAPNSSNGRRQRAQRSVQ
jgi:hypothetical protein